MRDTNETEETEAREAAWIDGHQAANRSLLSHALREVLTFKPEETTEIRLARAALELAATRAMLRRVCAEHGDLEWDDDLHLADVVDNHLVRYLVQRLPPDDDDSQAEEKQPMVDHAPRVRELEETIARLEQKIAALSAGCEKARTDCAVAQRCLIAANDELRRNGKWVNSGGELVSLCDYHGTKPGTDHARIEKCSEACAWYWPEDSDERCTQTREQMPGPNAPQPTDDGSRKVLVPVEDQVSRAACAWLGSRLSGSAKSAESKNDGRTFATANKENQMTEPESIVRALAQEERPIAPDGMEMWECRFCAAPSNCTCKPACTHRRAVEWVKANPVRPPPILERHPATVNVGVDTSHPCYRADGEPRCAICETVIARGAPQRTVCDTCEVGWEIPAERTIQGGQCGAAARTGRDKEEARLPRLDAQTSARRVEKGKPDLLRLI